MQARYGMETYVYGMGTKRYGMGTRRYGVWARTQLKKKNPVMFRAMS